MSQDEEKDVLKAMRSVWGANTTTADDLEQFCPTAKVCKNTAELGIHGMDDPHMATAMRSEWKKQLQADGKLHSGAETVADLVAAADESRR